MGELETLLLDTVKANNFVVALELIEASPDLATKRLDASGYTVVHYASKHGNQDAIEKILGLCDTSDVESLFRRGPTPTDVARENGHVELEGILSALFPGNTRTEGGTGADPDDELLPQQTQGDQNPSSGVDAELDITGLATHGRAGVNSGGGSSNHHSGGGGELGGFLQGLLGALQGAVSGEGNEGGAGLPLLGHLANFAGLQPPFMRAGSGREHVGTGLPPLHRACLAGDEAKVISLVNDDNFDINSKDFKGRTPLMAATQKGHAKIVKFLVSRNECAVDEATNSGITALHLATHAGHSEIVTILLHDGHCDCMAEDKDGTVALHLAALKGYTDIVELLAGQNNCNPSHADHKGHNALHCACQEGHLAIVRLLIDEKGCDPNRREYENRLSPLHYAVVQGHKCVVEYMCGLESVDTEAIDKQGRNCVFKACRHGHIDLVTFLIESCNANYTRGDNESVVPLHVAAYEGHVPIVEFLSQLPGIDMESKNGRTALHYACQQGKLPVVKCLIEKCGSLNRECVDKESITPLHLAAGNGHFDTVKYLCTNRCSCSDPSKTDISNRTPLHYAAHGGYSECKLEVVKFLVEECNLDVMCKDSAHEVVPLHLAANNGHTGTVRYLCDKRNCPVDIQDKHKRTPLHYAAKYNHLEVARYLVLEKSCDVAMKDKLGLTALDQAMALDSKEVANFLRQQGAKSSASTGTILEELLTQSNLLKSNLENAADLQMFGLVETGNLEEVKAAFSARVNKSTPIGLNGETPLHLASISGHLEVVKYLVMEQRMNPNAADREKRTPVHFAAHEGHTDILSFYLEREGCDFTLSDDSGRKPLHYAAQNGHLRAVMFLIQEAKCSSMVEDNEKSIPIHLAAFNGNMDIVKFLAKQENCNANHPDDNGRTALHCASQEGFTEVVVYLVNECNCDPMAADSIGQFTSLHFAAAKGHSDIVRFFCSLGTCDVEVKDNEGRTPLHQAAQKNQLEVVKI